MVLQVRLRPVGRSFNPARVSAAVAEAAQYIADEWKRRASEAFQYPTGNYVDSIYLTRVDDNTWEILSGAEYAQPLEGGFDSFDMKLKIRQGKHRLRKDGSAYRVVPFRHGTPGTVTMPPMPKAVFDSVKNETEFPAEYLGTKYEGMVRTSEVMARVSQATASEAKRRRHHTQYFTFRTLSETSNGWEHPGVQPYHLVDDTYNAVLSVIRENISAAVGLVELV